MNTTMANTGNQVSFGMGWKEGVQITGEVLKVIQNTDFIELAKKAEDLYRLLSDSPTNISGSWQFNNLPVAIRRDGKKFSLVVSPADPDPQVLVGGAIKKDGVEKFVFQGVNPDGSPVSVSLWLANAKTLQGLVWTMGEIMGEDDGRTVQLVKLN
jgi:hypothetical protein